MIDMRWVLDIDEGMPQELQYRVRQLKAGIDGQLYGEYGPWLTVRVVVNEIKDGESILVDDEGYPNEEAMSQMSESE